MVKRSKIEITRDILLVISSNQNSIGPTVLMRKSNLSFQMFEEYIEELEYKDFIEKVYQNNKSKRFNISLTQKGMNFLNKFYDFEKFLEEFGF